METISNINIQTIHNVRLHKHIDHKISNTFFDKRNDQIMEVLLTQFKFFIGSLLRPNKYLIIWKICHDHRMRITLHCHGDDNCITTLIGTKCHFFVTSSYKKNLGNFHGFRHFVTGPKSTFLHS